MSKIKHLTRRIDNNMVQGEWGKTLAFKAFAVKDTRASTFIGPFVTKNEAAYECRLLRLRLFSSGHVTLKKAKEAWKVIEITVRETKP